MYIHDGHRYKMQVAVLWILNAILTDLFSQQYINSLLCFKSVVYPTKHYSRNLNIIFLTVYMGFNNTFLVKQLSN